MRLVQALSFEVLDTSRASVLVEQHARGQRVELDRQPIRIALLHVHQPFARAHALIIARRHRRVAGAKRIGRDDAPVIGIAEALEARRRREADFFQRVTE